MHVPSLLIISHLLHDIVPLDWLHWLFVSYNVDFLYTFWYESTFIKYYKSLEEMGRGATTFYVQQIGFHD